VGSCSDDDKSANILELYDKNVLLAQHHSPCQRHDASFMPPFSSSCIIDFDKSIMVLRDVKDGVGGKSHAFNPLPLIHPSVDRTWPRGFPLEDIKDPAPTGALSKVAFGSLHLLSVGMIQSVCNGDPDVDAAHRLTRPLPLTFDSYLKALKLLALARALPTMNSPRS
jgi:hypothetical protein